MFTANSELEVGPGLPSARRSDSQEFAHAININGDERISFQKAFGGVFTNEAGAVFWQERRILSKYILMVGGDTYNGLSTNESERFT